MPSTLNRLISKTTKTSQNGGVVGWGEIQGIKSRLYINQEEGKECGGGSYAEDQSGK